MDQRRTIRLEPEPEPIPQPTPPRKSSRRISGKAIIIPSVTFLVGVVISVMSIVLYALSISGSVQPIVPVPPAQHGDIEVQVGTAYITHLVGRDLRSSGIGDVSHVVVTLAKGDQMTINGDDQVMFGFTRPFTIVVQPFVDACQLKVRVLRAELGGISITGFVAKFESQINQQLEGKSTNLPAGFIYCKTSVSTEPQGLHLTYSAKPV
jgi:hypothetical protein